MGGDRQGGAWSKRATAGPAPHSPSFSPSLPVSGPLPGTTTSCLPQATATALADDGQEEGDPVLPAGDLRRCFSAAPGSRSVLNAALPPGALARLPAPRPCRSACWPFSWCGGPGVSEKQVDPAAEAHLSLGGLFCSGRGFRLSTRLPCCHKGRTSVPQSPVSLQTFKFPSERVRTSEGRETRQKP